MKATALVFLLIASFALGMAAIDVAFPPMTAEAETLLSLWPECEELPDPKFYVDASAPATKFEPAVLHVYWNPTGGPIDVGSAPYWLIRARPVDGGVFIEVEWPTKPTIPWLARLDWKGGPLEGKFSGGGWTACK